jgi:hypothetical protein
LKLACLANIVLVVCQHLRGFLDLAKSSCDWLSLLVQHEKIGKINK